MIGWVIDKLEANVLIIDHNCEGKQPIALNFIRAGHQQQSSSKQNKDIALYEAHTQYSTHTYSRYVTFKSSLASL